MRSILYYITGHGYGHAVRASLVIRALQRVAVDVSVHVRTTAPDWLFHETARPVSYSNQCLDIGIVQPNGLEMDLKGTIRACKELQSRLPELIEQEIRYVRNERIDLVVSDISPPAFEIAAQAGIPSVAVTNFTWDVIYRAYAARYPDFGPLIEEMTAFYRKATLALTLPYPCEMNMFAKRESIPWIGRRSLLTRDQARALFRLPPNRIVVLVSFGGIGFDNFPWQRLVALSDYFFVVTASTAHRGDNFQVLPVAQRRYADLLRAADVVVTKPGYGIVADVLAHRVPVLYTERGEFPEYPCLVQALTDLATAEFVPQADLLSGEIRQYLERLTSKTPQWPVVALGGADAAAQKILGLLDVRPR